MNLIPKLNPYQNKFRTKKTGASADDPVFAKAFFCRNS